MKSKNLKIGYNMGLLNFKEGFMWKFFRKYIILVRQKDWLFGPSAGCQTDKTPWRRWKPRSSRGSDHSSLLDSCYRRLTARSNTLQSAFIPFCLRASLFRRNFLINNDCFMLSILQRGQRRSHAAMMYKLMGWESEASGYVPEQLVDLIMRSPEMSSAVAPRHN